MTRENFLNHVSDKIWRKSYHFQLNYFCNRQKYFAIVKKLWRAMCEVVSHIDGNWHWKTKGKAENSSLRYARRWRKLIKIASVKMRGKSLLNEKKSFHCLRHFTIFCWYFFHHKKVKKRKRGGRRRILVTGREYIRTTIFVLGYIKEEGKNTRQPTVSEKNYS